MKLLLAGCALVTVLAALAPTNRRDTSLAARDAGPGAIEVSSYPEEQRRNYEIFSSKCSRCHPLARPINSRFSAGEWKRYLIRMVHRADSDIDPEQAARIYEFLKYRSARPELLSPPAPRHGDPLASFPE